MFTFADCKKNTVNKKGFTYDWTSIVRWVILDNNMIQTISLLIYIDS